MAAEVSSLYPSRRPDEAYILSVWGEGTTWHWDLVVANPLELDPRAVGVLIAQGVAGTQTEAALRASEALEADITKEG